MLVTRKGRSIKRHSDRMRRKDTPSLFKHAAINYIKTLRQEALLLRMVRELNGLLHGKKPNLRPDTHAHKERGMERMVNSSKTKTFQAEGIPFSNGLRLDRVWRNDARRIPTHRDDGANRKIRSAWRQAVSAAPRTYVSFSSPNRATLPLQGIWKAGTTWLLSGDHC